MKFSADAVRAILSLLPGIDFDAIKNALKILTPLRLGVPPKCLGSSSLATPIYIHMTKALSDLTSSFFVPSVRNLQVFNKGGRSETDYRLQFTQ